MITAREQIRLFFTNPVLLSCIFSWLSAQLIKTLIKLFSGKVHSIGELFELLFWRTGSMPSSHAALVTSLCTTIGFRSGINSDVFILSVGFFLVTIRDAVGGRRANGIFYRLSTWVLYRSCIQCTQINEDQFKNNHFYAADFIMRCIFISF